MKQHGTRGSKQSGSAKSAMMKSFKYPNDRTKTAVFRGLCITSQKDLCEISLQHLTLCTLGDCRKPTSNSNTIWFKLSGILKRPWDAHHSTLGFCYSTASNSLCSGAGLSERGASNQKHPHFRPRRMAPCDQLGKRASDTDAVTFGKFLGGLEILENPRGFTSQ